MHHVYAEGFKLTVWLIIWFPPSVLARPSHWPTGATLTYCWCWIWILHNWMTPLAARHPETPLPRNPSSRAKSSQICCHILLTRMHMQHLIYFMILVWTLTLSGNLAVCTKRCFRAWNKQAAETNNMVLMCHKLYLSALFQTPYAHPASCWEGGCWPCDPSLFWVNFCWTGFTIV